MHNIIAKTTLSIFIFSSIFLVAGCAPSSSTTPTLLESSAQSTSSSITAENALQLVSNLPEVKKYLADLSAASSTGHITTDEELKNPTTTPYWYIHVFEDKGDHQATFNWYKVYTQTGTVEKEFNP